MDLKKHEELLNKLRANDEEVVLDGAVDNDQWSNLKGKRILWILKEANGTPQDNDLRKLLNELASTPNPNKIYAKWKTTYGLVVKVSYGLLNGYDKLGDWADNVDTIRGVLKDIAVINVNKRAGARKANLKMLTKCAEEFHDIILKQIELLDPDIIILGGVKYVLSKWLPDNDSRKKWITTDHPGQRRLTHRQYYSSILKQLKA